METILSVRTSARLMSVLNMPPLTAVKLQMVSMMISACDTSVNVLLSLCVCLFSQYMMLFYIIWNDYKLCWKLFKSRCGWCFNVQRHVMFCSVKQRRWMNLPINYSFRAESTKTLAFGESYRLVWSRIFFFLMPQNAVYFGYLLGFYTCMLLYLRRIKSSRVPSTLCIGSVPEVFASRIL